jgi:hypothetical protein
VIELLDMTLEARHFHILVPEKSFREYEDQAVFLSEP